jgi:hypothetical protein
LSPAFKQNNPSVYPFQDADYSRTKLKRIASVDILNGIALILLTFNTSLVFLYKVPEVFKFSGFRNCGFYLSRDKISFIRIVVN